MPLSLSLSLFFLLFRDPCWQCPLGIECTFEAGLRWFCDRVKEKVMARLDVEPELSDVVEVCQAWEDGLVAL